MVLMHVFEEDDKTLRKEHVKYWFGTFRNEDDEYDAKDGSYVVCYCGGRLLPLEEVDGDIKTAIVWHVRSFRGLDAV